MSLKVPFAAVLRVLRSREGLTQEDLHAKSSRQYFGELEQGKSSVTLDKLQALSSAFRLSPATIVALTMAVDADLDVESVLQQIADELRAVEVAGGLTEAKSQIRNGALVSRPTGVSVNRELLDRVLECKAKGMTQKDTAVHLGMSKATVNRYWKRDEG